MSLIELQNISKSYDGKNLVLDNINLEVEQGEFFILVGPSGCGKSTLLRMIAGLEEITGGVLKIAGQIANSLPPKDRKISMVFQNYALYPHMTVKENILFGLDVKKIPREEQEIRVLEAANLIGLTDYLKRKPGQLSGGQRQRVALARSICSRSPICLMDEPLSNLDAKLRGQMRTEIRRIQKQLGLTILYVTHDQVEAMTMGDRIMVLNGGHIQQVGTPLELYNRPANRFVAGFIGSPQMNLARGRVMESGLLLNGKLRIELNDAEKQKLPPGEAFLVGIRAEHLTPGRENSRNSCAVKLVNVEMMGNETQVVFAVGKELFTARWQGQHDVEIGSTVMVEIRPECLLYFDPETELLLRPAQDTGRTRVNQAV